MSHGPRGHFPRRDTPAPNIFWNGPDGTRYRIWLEEAPRHLKARDARGILTFVDMSDPNRQLHRRVAEGAVLEELGEEELVELLGEGTAGH